MVVEDACAAGAVVGEADSHAAGVGVALDASCRVVVDGVALPVVPLPAAGLACRVCLLLDVHGGAAFAGGDVQAALPAAFVQGACAFDDFGVSPQRVEFEVQGRPGGVEPPAALDPAAGDVYAPAQRCHAQVSVRLLVFAIEPVHPWLARGDA